MKRRSSLFVLGLVLIAALVWLRWPAAAPEPVVVTPPPSERHARTWKPGARTPVPRGAKKEGAPSTPSAAASPSDPGRTPNQAPPSAATADASAAPSEGDAPTGPIDRREHPPADAAQVQQAVMSRLNDVEADISACLAEWRAVDPDLEGEVNMGFQIDADGLQQAAVVDHTDVPLGPLSCFSAAIDTVDWSGVTSEPVEITFPFQIAPEDP